MPAETLRFELFVRDVEASTGFFTQILGFSIHRSDGTYVELRCGGVTIGLAPASALPTTHPIRADRTERLGLGVEIVIETDDVDDAYRKAEASGYPIATALDARAWGLRDFRVVSPDGYYVRVTSR
jgi:catechol 2,3-dioxygenase-like lactoylglutathione lyase family enzyme